MQQQYGPVPFFGPATSFASWDGTRVTAYSALREPLPDNVHLLALKTDVGTRWNSAVLRLQHIYEVTANNALSQPVTVNPAALFAGVYNVSEELELSGVLPAAAVPRMQWTPASDVTPPWVIPVARHNRDVSDATTAPVTLTPMALSTYRLTFSE